MRTISVTEALRELKLLNSRIYKVCKDGTYVGAAKKASDMIGHQKKDTFMTNAKASYDSAIALIKNRNILKAAIVESNAKTMVEIGGKTMTVAEAIERKTSIVYEKELLETMRQQYASAISSVTVENAKMEKQIDKLLEGYFSRDVEKKIAKDEQDAIANPYRAANEFALCDPLNIADLIAKLDEDISTFESEVDFRLSICNSLTMISVDY